jgi:hypothetical protein
MESGVAAIALENSGVVDDDAVVFSCCCAYLMAIILTIFQSRVELIEPLSQHVQCDNDSFRAAVVQAFRLVADADWKQRELIDSRSSPDFPGRSSSNIEDAVHARSDLLTGSSVASSFRCELIRHFASAVGILVCDKTAAAAPNFTRSSVG